MHLAGEWHSATNCILKTVSILSLIQTLVNWLRKLQSTVTIFSNRMHFMSENSSLIRSTSERVFSWQL